MHLSSRSRTGSRIDSMWLTWPATLNTTSVPAIASAASGAPMSAISTSAPSGALISPPWFGTSASITTTSAPADVNGAPHSSR